MRRRGGASAVGLAITLEELNGSQATLLRSPSMRQRTDSPSSLCCLARQPAPRGAPEPAVDQAVGRVHRFTVQHAAGPTGVARPFNQQGVRLHRRVEQMVTSEAALITKHNEFPDHAPVRLVAGDRSNRVKSFYDPAAARWSHRNIPLRVRLSPMTSRPPPRPGRFTALPGEHTLHATVVAPDEHGFSVEDVDDLDARARTLWPAFRRARR